MGHKKGLNENIMNKKKCAHFNRRQKNGIPHILIDIAKLQIKGWDLETHQHSWRAQLGRDTLTDCTQNAMLACLVWNENIRRIIRELYKHNPF